MLKLFQNKFQHVQFVLHTIVLLQDAEAVPGKVFWGLHPLPLNSILFVTCLTHHRNNNSEIENSFSSSPKLSMVFR